MSHFGKKAFDIESDIPDLSGKVVLVTGGELENPSTAKKTQNNNRQATLVLAGRHVCIWPNIILPESSSWLEIRRRAKQYSRKSKKQLQE
jgi:hypothetical protein